MLDRASSLADEEILKLLHTRFVPVAIDQHIHRRLRDAEGDLFARVLKQAGRDLDGRSQGNFLFSPDGKLLAFANTADAGHVKRLMKTALAKFDPSVRGEGIDATTKPPALFEPPEGGLVVDVTCKVLGGYEKEARTSKEAREALGQDHLWLRKDEAEALAQGKLLDSVQQRIALYHLIDNTRGEPPLWRSGEIKHLDMTLKDGRITGTVHLETKSGHRGYRAKLLGFVKAEAGKVTRFDMVVRGDFWGEGTFTRGAPQGKFPFAVAFTLADDTCAADRVLPGGARGNLPGYLR